MRYTDDAALAADELTAQVLAKKPRAKRSRGGASARSIAKAHADVAEMMESKVFTSAEPHHLVAMYAWCHQRVYGAPAGELTGLPWSGAVSAARKLVKDEFGGNMAAAVEYVRWTWRREQWREKKRRETPVAEGFSAYRVGWRLQFASRVIVTDYRCDLARRNSP